MEVMDLEIIMPWIIFGNESETTKKNSSKTEKTTTSKKNNSGKISNKNDDGLVRFLLIW